MDKINIVSSQAVLKVPSFSMDTRSKSSSPLVASSKIDCSRPHQTLMSGRFNANYGFVSDTHDAARQCTLLQRFHETLLLVFFGAILSVPF